MSHETGIIVLKDRKVTGTSLEIALSSRARDHIDCQGFVIP